MPTDVQIDYDKFGDSLTTGLAIIEWAMDNGGQIFRHKITGDTKGGCMKYIRFNDDLTALAFKLKFNV
jgi:hypothetical protein